jgi:chromosome segregation ATPase
VTEMLEILTAIRADIAEIKSDVAEVKSDVAEVKSDVAEVKSDVAEVKVVQAEHTRQLARQERSIAMLQQDVTKIRNVHLGQELKLDDIQDHIRRVALGIENLRPPAVPPTLGEGSPSELRVLHSEFNALQRKTAELQARIELLEGRRTW